jgi:hypothetical protein
MVVGRIDWQRHEEKRRKGEERGVMSADEKVSDGDGMSWDEKK